MRGIAYLTKFAHALSMSGRTILSICSKSFGIKELCASYVDVYCATKSAGGDLGLSPRLCASSTIFS